MIGEVKVYDKNMKLKKVISRKTILKKMYAECGSLKTDVNLNGARRSTFKPRKKPVRKLECYGCHGVMSTTAAMKMYFCRTGCGDDYRIKNPDAKLRLNKAQEIPWVQKNVKHRAMPVTKSKRGHGK
jgi:hypothetical protein